MVEVVKEDLAVKQALFAKVEPHLKSGAIVSSNTSGLSVTGMLEGRGPAFRKSFLVTHFFNPVRYMKLLELVAGPDTEPGVLARMARFGEETLGKGIVWAKDSTNFIANRIGTYGMLRVLRDMQKAELTVEEVDKIFGPAMGRPKSAVFRTTDIVGLDTFVHVAQNCYDTLTRDEERETFQVPDFVRKMVAAKMLGDKTGQGFYKKVKGKDGESEIQVLDLATLTYRPQAKVRFDSLGAAKGIDDVAERIRDRAHRDGQGGEVRRARDARLAGLRQPPHPGDLRRPGQHRPGAPLGLRLGPRARSRSGTRTASARAWSG